MAERRLEALDVLEVLERKLAYLPGGRDREGRPLMIVNLPIEPRDRTAKKAKLERLAIYLLTVFNDETRRNGVCVIIDARQGAWRVARSYIRRTVGVVRSSATRVIVVRPEGFWEKRVDNCTKSRKDGEPIYIPMTRLGAHVETLQLPYDLGGARFHDHPRWIRMRMRVEEYEKRSEILLAKMAYLRGKLWCFDPTRPRDRAEVDLGSYWEAGTELAETAQDILISGRNLLSAMSRESSQDYLDTVQNVNRILDTIELEQVELEKGWTKLTQSLDTAREINDLEKGVNQVTNWILGPADFMLNSHCQVGYDVASSENLRLEHEGLELECRNAYSRYAELARRLDNVPDDRLTEDLKYQREFMDFVCGNFANRLERRRNVLVTSQRFFRLVSGYFDRTSEVFDKLVMGNHTCALSQATLKLQSLEKSQTILDDLQRQLVHEGEKLTDLLSTPIRDALGHQVPVDYAEDIANLSDILEASGARKNIFNDSVELQKLTLKQMALIHAYESDAEQAVKWLDDLYGMVISDHIEVGTDAGEIQRQKLEHQTFQDTAKGTFDYGYQLANGARVLRISCRLELASNTSLAARLRLARRRLRSLGQEQLTRLRVSAVFHRSVDEHLTAFNELIGTIDEAFLSGDGTSTGASFESSLGSKAEKLRSVLDDREKLLPDVRRTIRLGRLLRPRLREPLLLGRMSSTEESSTRIDEDIGNRSAIDAISERLAEVTRLAEKLDESLYEAGARIRKATMRDTFIGKEKNRDEESLGEDYATATECTTTPIARSRSESFATISEPDEPPGNETNDECQNATETPRSAEKIFEIPKKVQISCPEEHETPSDPEILVMPKENGHGDRDTEKTSSRSIIERVEEKCGKIVKEVTETTTLRVSHDTRLGLASYKLTSNTVREAREHADVRGILEAEGFALKSNGEANDKSREDFNDYNREEISISNSVPTTDEFETNGHTKFAKIVRETSGWKSVDNSDAGERETVLRVSGGLESRGNNDSGIEMTPGRNGEFLGDELHDEMETVSPSSSVNNNGNDEGDFLTRRPVHGVR